MLELAGFRADAVPPVCRDEFRGAAAVAPRIVGGYTELDTSAMAASLVVELRDDIAAGLARIPTPVPGLGAETDVMIAFGLAADVARAREFALARLDAIAADPFECEAFAGLQAAIPELRLALTQPLPLPVDALKGLSLTLDIGDFDINSATGLPSDIEMSALVVTDDVEGTIAMLAAMDPAIAALDLQPDGQLVELTGPNAFFGPGANPFGSIVFGATTTSIGVGLGEAGDAALERLLQARPGDPATVMSMSMDLARYYSLVADLLVGQAFAGDPQSVAVAASMSEMMRSIQAIYTRETIAVRFTGRGIEVPIRLELAGDN
jgi:hypothetical protein